MAVAIGRVGLEPLRPDQAEEVLHYWQRAHPLHPLELWMLKERLFGPPPADPDLLLAARGAGDELVGLAGGGGPRPPGGGRGGPAAGGPPEGWARSRVRIGRRCCADCRMN